MKRGRLAEGFEFAGLKCWREGTNVFMRNERTEEMQNDFGSRVKEKFPVAKEKISRQVAAIIGEVKRCNPIVLLMHCRIRFIGGMGVSERTRIWKEDEECKARALEFLQNVIVTHKCEWDKNEDIREMRQRCEEVIEATENLYMEMLGFSFYYYHIAEQMTPDKGLQNFISGSQMMYLVRGKRDVNFNERYFSLLFKYHEDIFRQMFDLSAKEVTDGVLSLIRALCNEKVMLFAKHQLEVAKFLNSGDESEEGWDAAEKAHEEFWSQAEDIECFNVRKITGWSEPLLEALSLPVGTCDQVITHDYQFWPLDDFVIKDRPFVKIGSEYYCFDQYNFSDNIYRALFRVFKEKDTKSLWSSRQTTAIESAVSEVFAHMLPGCRQLKNVRYFLKGDAGHPQELDLVVLCSGMTIVVEAKGIWLRHTSPIVDLKSTKAFYEQGIAKAGFQSRRFQEHLDESNCIELFDEHNQLVFSASREELGTVCRMCVTTDNATEIVASTAKLAEVGIDATGLICISLDDLLVYERYFTSPMVFAAYLMQRLKATFMTNVSASDEFDHLGFFINNPCYCAYVQTQAMVPGEGSAYICIDENRRELDDFFASLSDPRVKKPVVYMPSELDKIIDCIWRSPIANKCDLAEFFVCLDKDRKDWLVKVIEDELDAQRQGNAQHLRACPGESERGIDGFCFYVNTPWGARIGRQEMRARLKSIMVKTNESRRRILRLEYDPCGALVDAGIEQVKIDELNDIPRELVDETIAEINSRAVKRYVKTNGEPKRNDPCPCGSGKKYKRCCGRLLV